MAPFYEQVCNQLGWQVDLPFLQAMKDKNAAELVKLEATIKGICFISTYFDNVLKMPLRIWVNQKSERHIWQRLSIFAERGLRCWHFFFLEKFTCKAEAETAFRVAYEKTTSLGQRMDILFNLVRLGIKPGKKI